MGLKESDIEVLEALKNYTKTTTPIQFRQSSKSCRLTFNNKESIAKFMETYGFSYSKTYNPCEFSYYSAYSRDQLLALLVGIIDGDGSIDINSKTGYANVITITAHKIWKRFYENLLTFLSIPIYISEISDSNCLSIRIYKREVCLMLKDFITSNNLFYLSRKWNKIQIKDPSLEVTK